MLLFDDDVDGALEADEGGVLRGEAWGRSMPSPVVVARPSLSRDAKAGSNRESGRREAC